VFVGVALLAYVTPGPDWFLVLRRAAQGRRVGLGAALGVQAGLLVHMIVASVGVAAVLLSSAALFTLLKLVGAAYLAYLGIAALVDARRADARGSDSAAEPAPPPLLVVFRQALLANVLNPKAALFFVAVLPQFLSPTAPVAPQVLLLGTLDIVLGLAWWWLFVRAVARVARLLSGSRGRVVVGRITGVALTGLGVGLVFAEPAGA
jgi:threonine/homoserine/homoserine lactone efflux protein